MIISTVSVLSRCISLNITNCGNNKTNVGTNMPSRKKFETILAPRHCSFVTPKLAMALSTRQTMTDNIETITVFLNSIPILVSLTAFT